MLERHDARLEPRLRQQAQPCRSAEQTLDVPVVFDTHTAIGLAQQVGVVDNVGGVGRIGIARPCQVPQRSRLAIMTAMIGRLAEVLAYEVRREERRATRSAVDERGVDCLAQIGFGRHVAHGVVDEDRVELSSEPHVPHVAVDVLAFRVQCAADGPHPLRWFHEHHLEAGLEMRGVVAAAAAELEDRARRPAGGGRERIRKECGFLLIIGWRRQKGPP
jgi:hypothetical protein